MDFVNVLNSDTYSFLRDISSLGHNIAYLTVGGSYAYGTEVEGSDLDLRGVTLEREKEWIGLSKFDQYNDSNTDTEIYGFKKMIDLLIECNPNVVELFGTKREHVFISTWVGDLLRDNIDMFLTRRAASSFGGYATDQLRRIQNALARDSYPDDLKMKHILSSINKMKVHLQERYYSFTEDEIRIYLDQGIKDPNDKALFIDWTLKKFPLQELRNITSELTNVVRDYNKLKGRNKKRSEEKLSKHAMHLVRLLLAGTKVLRGEGLQTNWKGTEEHKILMDIRNEVISLEDVFSYVDELEKEFGYACDNSPLPLSVDRERVESLVVTVGRSVVGRF